jgi:hypothetical protein
MRLGPFQDFRIVVIKPLKAMITIKRLNVLTHPAAKIALAVSVDFDFRLSCQG